MPHSEARLLSCILIASLTSCSHLQKQFSPVDWLDPHHIDKILATDPAYLSPEQFYQYEQAILSGYSGSGGYSVEDEQIAWLRKAEAAFRTRGVELKDEWERGYAIADSYLNRQRYKRAYREFKKINDQAGMELAEWLMHNDRIRNGLVKITEYPGEIPCKASENTRAEDERYSFVAYFKGPVYRYDKQSKKHAIVYMPHDKYDWCDKLEVEGNKVIIHLRDKAGTYAFDNEGNEICSICNVLREASRSNPR